MEEFDLKKYLGENRLVKEDNDYPQVDIEIQGEIYTVPVNQEDRERIFNYDGEYELEEQLEALGFDLEGTSVAAFASDLNQKDVVDSYGNEDVKTFKRIKFLGVQLDILNGMYDDEIEMAASKLV